MITSSTTGPDKCTICQAKKKAVIKNAGDGLCVVPGELICPFEKEIEEAKSKIEKEIEESKIRTSFVVKSIKLRPKPTFKTITSSKDGI